MPSVSMSNTAPWASRRQKGRGSPRKRTKPPAGATAPICAAGTVASKVVMRWLPGDAAVIVLQRTATGRKGTRLQNG